MEKEIFKGKTLADLYGEIYTNSRSTRKQVRGLIEELKETMTGEGATPAHVAIPLLTSYLEVGVKNDEHLLKLATVIQRSEAAQTRGDSLGDFGLSDIESLIAEQQEIENQLKNTVESK